jgi:hypothetical protein
MQVQRLCGLLLLAPCMLSGATLAPKRFGVTVDGAEVELPYQASHSLETRQPAVKRVVISIHGANYNAQEAYNAVIIAAGGHAGAADPVCIVAPQLLRASELPGTVPEKLLYWNNYPFRGTSSARYGPSASRVSISVFDVLDRILETVTDAALFPELETVVVAGFSAGGQLVNRYAVAGRFEEGLPEDRGIHLRYLVMAPSSYLYFDARRDPEGDGAFSIPEGCAGYNDWGYGLVSLFSYPAATGTAAMRAQYPRRFVFHLVGSEDNDPADPSLATDCAASLQGPHRLARAQSYFLHLLDTFGTPLLDYQDLEVVPGAGHGIFVLLNSAPGRRYLLDRDGLDTDGDGQTDWAEWIAGTNAGDPGDRFWLSWSAGGADAEHGLRWPMVPGRRYRVLESPFPQGPFEERGAFDAPPQREAGLWPVIPGPGAQFFRVEARLR